MFKKQKCAGCRKMKYFVKYRELFPKFMNGLPVKSLDKLCWWCGRKLKILTRKTENE